MKPLKESDQKPAKELTKLSSFFGGWQVFGELAVSDTLERRENSAMTIRRCNSG
jgi:hypothetical protein